MTARSFGLMLLGCAVACSSGGDDATRAQLLASTQGDSRRGEAFIAKYGCGSCHVIPGVSGARGKVGPPLTDFAQRSYIAGNAINTPSNLAAWIQRPDSVEPGTVMPALGVKEQEAHDISAYLYHETATGALGPPSLLPAWLLRAE